MFASNIVKKAKEDFKEKAQDIFAKISSVLGLQHFHYEGNTIVEGNYQLTKNTTEVKGRLRDLKM